LRIMKVYDNFTLAELTVGPVCIAILYRPGRYLGICLCIDVSGTQTYVYATFNAKEFSVGSYHTHL